MRNKLLVAALIVVALASVAYAAFVQILTINGTGTSSGSWNVAITGITQTSATGATEATAASFTATSATFDVNLATLAQPLLMTSPSLIQAQLTLC